MSSCFLSCTHCVSSVACASINKLNEVYSTTIEFSNYSFNFHHILSILMVYYLQINFGLKCIFKIHDL